MSEELKNKTEEKVPRSKESPEGNSRKRKRKGPVSRMLDILIVLVFLGGIGVMLYPRISDWVNVRSMSRYVQSYQSTVRELAPADYTEILRVARDYNRRLKENGNPFSVIGRTEGYEDALRVDSSGIMGYVTIEKIRVRLPFYHGTDERVLQKAIGHVEGSSLPIGDEGEHAVLSAHRGLPSAKLFTDLPELETGDTFEITVLDKTFTYEVDRILTVLPEEMETLRPEEGKDLVTLVTCTPYGINTHRLLVRGHRISERPAGREKSRASENGGRAESSSAENAGQSYDRYVPYAVGAAVVIFLILLLAPVRKRK